jgi:hypothetical protein
MTFESRIRAQLNSELAAVPAASGALDTVMARGRRRRTVYRVAQAAGGVAAVALAVAVTALVVNLRAGADFAASPITGTELEIIATDPVVLRGAPGPAPATIPDGTEVRLEAIETLLGGDSGEAAALRAEEQTNQAIVALGEVDGWRAFALHSPTLRVSITDASGRLVVGSASAAMDQAVVLSVDQGTFVIGRTSANAGVVTLAVDNERYWQRPVEGIAVFPIDLPDGSDVRVVLSDGSPDPLLDVTVGPEADQSDGADPEVAPDIIDTWVSQLGLDRTDAGVWLVRLSRACRAGVWHLDVAEPLAAEYIADDAALSTRTDGALPTPREGADALWHMALQYCPNDFPEEEVQTGPFVLDDLARAEEARRQAAEIAPWQQIASPPIAGRYAQASVWTGDEVIIWGGISAPTDPDSPEANDGAVYNPAADTWRKIAAAPAGMSGPARAVWTGSQMIVRTDHGSEGPAQLAAYDPGTDSWEEIPAAALRGAEGYAMAWTGDEVVFLGGSSGDVMAGAGGAAYSPSTHTWRAVTAPPNGIRRFPAAVWTGAELVVWGGTGSCAADGSSTCVQSPADGAAYDPATDSWRIITPTGAPQGTVESNTGSWTGSEMILFVAGDCAEPCSAAFAYDPVGDRWRSGAQVAGLGYPLLPGAWSGTALYVWDVSGAGFSYDPARDLWSVIDSGTLMADRYNGAWAWTGNGVLQWGGWNGAGFEAPFSDGFVFPVG